MSIKKLYKVTKSLIFNILGWLVTIGIAMALILYIPDIAIYKNLVLIALGLIAISYLGYRFLRK